MSVDPNRWEPVGDAFFDDLAARNRISDRRELAGAWRAEIELRAAARDGGPVDVSSPLEYGGRRVSATVCDQLCAATGALHVAATWKDGKHEIRREPVKLCSLVPFGIVAFATGPTIWQAGADRGAWAYHPTTVCGYPMIGVLDDAEVAARCSDLPRRRRLDRVGLVTDAFAVGALSMSGPTAILGVIAGEERSPDRAEKALVPAPIAFSCLLHAPFLRSRVPEGSFAPVILAERLFSHRNNEPGHLPWTLETPRLFAAVCDCILRETDPDQAMVHRFHQARLLTYRAWSDRDSSRSLAVQPFLSRLSLRQSREWKKHLANNYSQDASLRTTLARIEDDLVRQIRRDFAETFGCADPEAVAARLRAS